MHYLKILRIHQWIKNLFVFLPLFFSGQLLDGSRLFSAFIVFASFCTLSSAVYCLNDIMDAPSDRLHPEKKERPIASGKVKTYHGYILMFVMLSLTVFLLIFNNEHFNLEIYLIYLSYLILNLLYTVILKSISILDTFIIAFGFVLRLISGGLATHVVLSHWIVLMTFLLALLLAFAKRRDDVLISISTGILTRKNTQTYNIVFINQIISIIGSITMVCYIMYTLSDEVTKRLHTQYLYLTSVFVLAGIIRYLQITLVDEKSGNPTKVMFKDRFIQICLLAWIISFYLIIYFK